ncbi:MAG: NAD(P)-dependent oxidoreductase [Candidatus Pacebacteria bacterium]|nr:NAD(P)-dependent oxidoreductase [Candidatus Paceibacterota bacterium]
MKILVTGASGMVGSRLLPQLAKRFDVTGLDVQPGESSSNVIQADLTEYEQVKAAAEGMDAIIHLAALLCKPMADRSIDLNVKATANVLQAAVDNDVKRVVYCSSVWASGHGYTEPYLPIDEDIPCKPVCMYGQTKWLGELMTEYYARMHGLQAVIIRFCGFHPVEGYTEDGEIDWENADIPGIFGRYLRQGHKLMNPVDLGDAFGLAAEKPGIDGQRFIVGVSTPYSTVDAAALRSMPAAVIERYYPGVPAILAEAGVDIPPMPYYFNHEKARGVLGFRSRHDLGDIARLYCQWKGI